LLKRILITTLCHYDTGGNLWAETGREESHFGTPNDRVGGGMARITSRKEDEFAKELEDAMELETASFAVESEDLDVAASMEELEAQITMAAEELAREGRSEPEAPSSEEAANAATQPFVAEFEPLEEPDVEDDQFPDTFEPAEN